MESFRRHGFYYGAFSYIVHMAEYRVTFSIESEEQQGIQIMPMRKNHITSTRPEQKYVKQQESVWFLKN